MSLRAQTFFTIGCFTGLLVVAPAAVGQTAGKVPGEVIEQAGANRTVLVLVGLNVPWQMESSLTNEAVRAQRKAIVSVQSHLLNELAGTKHKIIRRYNEIPGIALEVGADALAALARSPAVTNVLLDRPAVSTPEPGEVAVENDDGVGQEKVPSELFKQAASGATVLVIAGLRAPWAREDTLSEELVALQRRVILSAQSYVLAELAGTQFRVMRLYREIPGIALRVGLDALKVLESSPAVTNVLPDRPAKAAP